MICSHFGSGVFGPPRELAWCSSFPSSRAAMTALGEITPTPLPQCENRCGRRANGPRFGMCCGACPARHTRECGARHPAECVHQCGRGANRPRFISCCCMCPDGHTWQCGPRQGRPGLEPETRKRTSKDEIRECVSAPESEDDIALCSLCRCEIPTDEVFWCLNQGCEWACYGVCFECLTGHVCRFAPVEISPLATG